MNARVPKLSVSSLPQSEEIVLTRFRTGFLRAEFALRCHAIAEPDEPCRWEGIVHSLVWERKDGGATLVEKSRWRLRVSWRVCRCVRNLLDDVTPS